MSKYIDAEKLKAEIERQKKIDGWCEVGKDTADVYYARGFRFACDNLSSFIDSLQQEQPEVDLEKEIYTCFEKYTKDAFGIPIEGRITKFEVEEIAHHFYELGLNARKEKINMTQEEFDYIKDSFSQILDDIGGNPDWYDAAKAVASDLGTMEKQLEERVTKLPSNLDEAAEDSWAVYEYRESPKGLYSTCYVDGYVDGFQAGAEWMAGQGETQEHFVIGHTEESHGHPVIIHYPESFEIGDEVIVQIRKKQ